MGTAGRAVAFSGTTVAVGLLALIALPLPFLRSMGYGGMLIPLVAIACAITLLPVSGLAALIAVAILAALIVPATTCTWATPTRTRSPRPGRPSRGSTPSTTPASARELSLRWRRWCQNRTLISVLTFLLLARAFRSLLLPAKAVVLNVLSVGAAWGVLALVWQEGHGSEEIWGIAATGARSTTRPLPRYTAPPSIRALLVPAVVSLFGRWNWWLPPGAARVLRVRPSPEPATEPSGA